jgi:hypothetical protein
MLRLLNVGFRTTHLVGFALLVGGHAWGIDPARLLSVLWLTVASGLALLGLEVSMARSWLFEARGLIILAKLGLFLLVPWAGPGRTGLLITVAIVASVGAHAPRWLRHAPLRSRHRYPMSRSQRPEREGAADC